MGFWPRYVPVAERRAKAAKQLKAAKAKGNPLNPVVVEGRQIAQTFWGKAWCEHLEKFSDYENRLPRGRTYVRNGSVIDLQISPGKVAAQVVGSYPYKIVIEIKEMAREKWKALAASCSGKIDSLIELLQGKFSKAVMAQMIDPQGGLFPNESEISMRCSCPDSADMCKHIAAVLYGVGACLDTKPEWLFTLRHVDHLELIATVGAETLLTGSAQGVDVLEDGDLSSLFGIDVAAPSNAKETPIAAVEKLPEKKARFVKKPKIEQAVAVDVSLLQAAKLLCITQKHLRQLVENKSIASSLKGKEERISFEEILRYRKKMLL